MYRTKNATTFKLALDTTLSNYDFLDKYFGLCKVDVVVQIIGI